MKAFNREPRLVSVILPSFDAGEYIQRTLESVLAQTYSNLEVLVVDDGSRDETAAIVRKVAEGDPRVRLLQQANAGVAAARYHALREARGEFIAPIDADDIWFPRKIEKQLERMMASDNSVGLVYTWVAIIDGDGRIIEWSSHDFRGNALADLTVANFIGSSSTPLIRHACIDAVGGYDSRFKEQGAQGSEDWDFYLRIAERYLFDVVPEFLVGYRQTPDSMSWQYTSMERSHALIMDGLRQRHPGLPERIFHWSLGNYCLYLRGKSYDKGRYGVSLRFLFRAVWHDPLRLLLPFVYSSFFKCLLRIAAWPFVRLIWKDHASWSLFWSRIRRGTGREYSLQELPEHAKKPPRRRLFTMLHQRRMARLKEELAAWQPVPHGRNHADMPDGLYLAKLDQCQP
ncbi:glycosyltransferase family 2 protein [bacterium]|nr:MAG: glycosyltransferase family 2 protein [bacterium]